MTEYTQTAEFTGARILMSDLTGLEIRDCDVSGLKLVDSVASAISVSGAFGRVHVNDVDVTAFVEAELDRRHPVRALAREATTVDDFRVAWAALETTWRDSLARARRLPEERLHERVDGEWSFVETQLHLLFASDAWLGNAVLEEDGAYHPWGLPSPGMPGEAVTQLGLTPDATPTLDEIIEPRLARMSTVRAVIDGLTDAELDRVCARKPAAPYPDEQYVVRGCLSVVLNEEAEHGRYVARDLDVLESGATRPEGPG